MSGSASGLAVIGYALVSLANLAFAAFLIRAGSLRRPVDSSNGLLLAAVVATAAWGLAALARERVGSPLPQYAASLLDLLRYGLWFGFVLHLLEPPAEGRPHLHAGLLPVVALLLLVWGVGANALIALSRSVDHSSSRPLLADSLALAVFGLLLLEQLFRNQGDDSRWGAKPVCLALGIGFVYDVYVFSEAVMFGRFDEDALSVRGAVHALATPLLFIASRRQASWLRSIQVSRTAAFYSATLLLIGAYLLFIAGVGYYIRYFGGDWGRALQLTVLFAALLFLAVLVFSGALRARLRVFLGKNFFSYRYDYRQEWLRFTAMLSTQAAPHEVGVLVVRGLADMVECPGGSLWSRALGEAEYVQTARWNAPAASEREAADSALCRFMLAREWIIDIGEYRSNPRRYDSLPLPLWLATSASAWVVIPLIVGAEMIGFVVLARPRTAVELNWEVRDLLKTAARQAAGFLTQMHATEALLEARKFDAFNRMSAFVVHDLKNIITQLSLMLKNAERLRDNPEFQQDMLLTVESSLDKMRQMMLQLREGEKPAGTVSGVDLAPLLQRVEAGARARGRTLEVQIVDRIATRGHEQRLERVVGHVVQNALDATPATGRVWVRLERSGGRAKVVVGDTGLGMSPEFIRTQLFKPFNSTKPSGMGIGSYESFQYLKELGGSIAVESEVGKGSIVTLLMPLFDSPKRSDLQAAQTR